MTSSRQLERFLSLHTSGALGFQPGLDGLRGIAVAGVIAFHGGFARAGGGYLGVSLFFTLSGFLITSLLLAQAGAGGIKLGTFWIRRFRRLLPAAWVTLALIILGAFLLGELSPRLSRDIWAALGQVVNWRFFLNASSYADLFRTPSPVLHYWSLAIEEQFYLVYPLLLWGIIRLARGRRVIIGLVLGSGAVLSFLLPLLAGLSLDRTYYGTDTRAGELLVGAVLAVLLTSGRVRQTLAGSRRWRGAVALAGVAALVGTLWLWATVSSTWPLITRGGLALVALLSSTLVLASMVPGGPIYRLFALEPLQWLGRVSYAVYLFHWPALVWASQERTGLPNLLRVALVVAGVFLLAALSRRYLELPIRRNVPAAAALVPWLAPVMVALIIAAPLLLASQVAPDRQLLAELEEAAQARQQTTAPAAPATPDQGTARAAQLPPIPAVDPKRVPRVASFGDSILLTLMMSIGHWSPPGQRLHDGGGVVELGCGIVRGGAIVTHRDVPISEKCNRWATTWVEALRVKGTPDFAVVMSCQWDTVDRRLPGSTKVQHPGQPGYDQLVYKEYLRAADTLFRAGVPLVVWATCPHFSQKVGVKDLPPELLRSRDPARIDRLNEIIRRVGQARPQRVRVLEWGEVADRLPDTARMRPDGSHYRWKKDTGVGKAWGKRIIATWRRWAQELQARQRRKNPEPS